MIRGLVIDPAPVLHRAAQEVKLPASPKVRSHCARLHGLLLGAPYAVGLAAPQIGLPLRLVAVRLSTGDDDPRVRVLINPVLELDEEGGTTREDEQCLSLPGVIVNVERFTALTVKAVTPRDGEVEWDLVDGEARLLQHEVDHLDGVLITDRGEVKVY